MRRVALQARLLRRVARLRARPNQHLSPRHSQETWRQALASWCTAFVTDNIKYHTSKNHGASANHQAAMSQLQAKEDQGTASPPPALRGPSSHFLTQIPQCDYQRPACGQCVRTRVQCLGYERDLVFVPHEAKPDTQVLPPKPSAAAKRASAAPSALPSPPSSIASSSSTVKFSSPSIPAGPNAGVQNRLDSFERFLQSYLPNRELYTSQWLPRVSQSRGRCVALDCVANAISTMMMGQITENANYKAHALRLYGHALSDMRSTFSKKSLQSEWHEVLMASMLMQIYEVGSQTLAERRV